MKNEEKNVITKGDILFSFILTRLLFLDDYIESLNSMGIKEKNMVFENVIANIMADTFFTKFDSNVNDRLYNILNYFRNIYKDEDSFNKINDAIDVLNKQDNLICVYPHQFDLRYETVFNKRFRRRLIKNQLEDVKELVKKSVLNDSLFFYDIDHMKGPEFNETYGKDLIYVSNATYLVNVFPEIFTDNMILIKVHNLLAYNMDTTKDDLKNNAILYAGSAMTLKKIYKIIKKNK